MAVIRKKIWPEYFDLVAAGKKKFELRLADFDLKEGDILMLEEWDPKTKQYTGRKMERRAGYMLTFNPNNFFGQESEVKEKGIYVIQLSDFPWSSAGLRYLALFGNILFILWIVYNGIDEGSRAVSSVQATSLAGLLCLLALNIFLLRQR